MNLALDLDEARVLTAALQRQIQWIEGEIVHTDKHELQRALSADLRAVRHLAARLANASASTSAAPPGR
ncbi:MAG TPA: hypothetical protein VGM56_14620 [Byssovorax sp.]|jgi:hypothetical protein